MKKPKYRVQAWCALGLVRYEPLYDNKDDAIRRMEKLKKENYSISFEVVPERVSKMQGKKLKEIMEEKFDEMS